MFNAFIQLLNAGAACKNCIFKIKNLGMSTKLKFILILPILGFLSFMLTEKPKQHADTEERIKKIYAEYCAGCHGEKMEAFVDRRWKYGTTKEAISASIANGSIDFGMPAYRGIIKEKDIDRMAELMVSYIKDVDQYKMKRPANNVFKSQGMTIVLDTIAADMRSPWGFTQLPDGNYLITDITGVLYLVDQHRNKTVIKNTPKVLDEGQGGLMDIELHPDYANNEWVYMAYSKFRTEGNGTVTSTAIIRGKIRNNEFTDQQEIFEAQPYTRTRHHYGSRIMFDNKGYLFFSVGERGREREFPQNTVTDNGKIHRLHDDGSIPKDNPFVNDKKNRGSIYSYGHRNPQGLIFDKTTGIIWEHEHGPRGGDELNIIRKGANYGWPVISYGINYDGRPITDISEKEGMEQPEIYWIPSIAPSGMAMVTGNRYPAWKGDIMAGSLRFMYLNRCVMKDNKVISQEKLLPNIGRLRNVKMGNDGYLYVSVERPGLVFRLRPQ